MRLGAGPLAIAGFFLPWAHGPGPFAANEFTGFSLVGFAGRLQALDLNIAQGGVLWAIRLAILGVAIAGTWQLLLAPAHRSHPGYHLSGWYLVAAATICAAIGLARSGVAAPPLGLGLVVLAAGAFAISWAFEKVASRAEQPNLTG
ncbi:MAG: hypothetical protein ABI577_02470 [bacterium]